MYTFADFFEEIMEKMSQEQLINQDENKPLVSVCVTAFNIANYIAQSLESILSQEVNFDYEIVIGEDFSVDNTREILKSYEINYPEKIRVIYNEKNLGMMPNLINIIESAKGKFIAIMDGDDFWVSNKKLKLQAEFLLANDEYSVCFHDAFIGDEFFKNLTTYSKKYPNRFLLYNRAFTLDDVIRWRGILSGTSTIMFRKSFDKFPSWVSKLGGLESMIFTLMFDYGKYHYINEAMSFYRRHHKSTDQSFSKINKAKRDINDYYIYFEKYYPICRLFLMKKILRNRFYIFHQSMISKKVKENNINLKKMFSEICMYVIFSLTKKRTFYFNTKDYKKIN